jgi:signal transduction histidine kinase
MSDAPRLRQVIRNLVTNAVRYGGNTIVVTTRPSAAGGSVIEVRDDGAGIGRLDPEGIFDPYTSAGEASSHPGSVGLGLTISRQLVRMMGGELGFERSAGWTIFRIELPPAQDTRHAAVV